MRYVPIVLGAICGSLGGLLWAGQESWGVRAIMLFFGAIAGLALGAVVARLIWGSWFVASGHEIPDEDEDVLSGLGFSAKSQMDRYIFDRGHPTSSPGFPQSDDPDPNSDSTKHF